jgi:hypothetical protein
VDLDLSRLVRSIASRIGTYEIQSPAHFREVGPKSEHGLDDHALTAVNPAGLGGLPRGMLTGVET